MPLRKIEDCSADKFIEYLNELFELDPDWLQSVIEHRPICNTYIVEHPTVQASRIDDYKGNAGFLGIINGFFGTCDGELNTDCGHIAADVDENNNYKLRGFCPFGNQPKKMSKENV